MQQRRLRLGDILDDYCPRERRITNHAVVAKIDDEVRRTRCLTCDTEHEYRQGKAPTLRKKKDTVAAAYREVLAEVTKGAQGEGEEPVAVPESAPVPEPAQAPAQAADQPEALPVEAVPVEAVPVEAAGAGPRPELEAAAGEAGGAEPEAARVHRRLIRATLPRPENQPVVRPIPEFTMRQPTGRAAKFRPAPARAQRAAAAGRPAAGAGRTFPARGGSAHAGRPARPDGLRARGPQHQRHGKKHSK